MSDPEHPALRIVRGDPSADEIAAVTAVVTAVVSAPEPPRQGPVRGRWNDPARMHRRYWPQGPGGWRAAR